MNKKSKHSSFSSSILLLLLVLLQVMPGYVNAADLSNSVSSVDPETLMSGADATDNKQGGPTVKLNFSSDGRIKSGQKVTAKAVAGGFSGDTNDIYYTWYIKKAGCDLRKNVGTGHRCDLDRDEDITENDWKIAATKIIMKGSFTGADYSVFTSSFDEKKAGEEAIPGLNLWKKTYDDDEENGSGSSVPNCYVQDTKSGTFFELRETTSPKIKDCPAGYHVACVKNVDTECYIDGAAKQIEKQQTAWNNAHPAEIAACEALPQCLSTYQIPVVPATDPETFETKTRTPEEVAECVYNCKITEPNKFPKKYENSPMNVCVEGSTNKDDMICDVKNTSISDLNKFHIDVTCDNGNEIATCLKDNSAGLSMFNYKGDTIAHILGKDNIYFDTPGISTGVVGSYDNTTRLSMCGNEKLTIPDPPVIGILSRPVDKSIFLPTLGTKGQGSSTCRGIINNIFSGGTDPDGNIIPANTALKSSCTFGKGENLCKHLFPYYPDNLGLDSRVGDGKFTFEEKKFWEADPEKVSTNGKQKDEAVAIGKGITDFTWTYMGGDMVGVVVEGKSITPTKHADASYMTMWAFPTGDCKALSGTNNNGESEESEVERSFYMEGTQGILTANMDLNECLEENLIEPDLGEMDSFVSASILLQVTPENPINDANGRGDVLNVAAGASNMKNVFYDWTVYISKDGPELPTDATTWKDVTDEVIKYKGFLLSNKQGLEKANLPISLNLPRAFFSEAGVSFKDFYFKIKTTATESNNIDSQKAVGEIVVRIGQQMNQIKRYAVKASDKGILSFTGNTPEELCASDSEQATCYVTKNEIIGAQVPNDGDLSGFSWKINGNDFTCSKEISTECSSPMSNTLFFPIAGNAGEAVDVSTTAKKCDSAGICNKIEVSRHFVIIEPQLQILSMDTSTAWRKILGYYKYLATEAENDSAAIDLSSKVMETVNGTQVKLIPAIYPALSASEVMYNWSVDGEIKTANSANSSIAFPASKLSGESYIVNLSAQLNPESKVLANNLRRALLKHWGFSQEDTIETDMATSIQINVVDNDAIIASDSNKGSLAASLITHLPEQVMFLLRIALTAFTLLISMGILFAFIPGARIENIQDEGRISI